jgi:TonB family protein
MLTAIVLATSTAASGVSALDARPPEPSSALHLAQCERALGDPMLRTSVPTMLFFNLRREACSCIKQGFEKDSGTFKDSAAIADVVAKCVNFASSVARPELLPTATLTAVSAAFQRPTSITPADRRPLDLNTCKLPEYPRPATRAEATGITRVAFLVNAQGSVTRGVVTRPSGLSEEHQLLDATALAHFKACKFAPAAGVDSPATWIEIEYQWKLE